MSAQQWRWQQVQDRLTQILERQQQGGRVGLAAKQVEAAAHPSMVFSSGSACLDRILPQGGFRRGSVVEYLSDDRLGMGGASLVAWLAAMAACRKGGALVVLDMPTDPSTTTACFYPPAFGSVCIREQGVAAASLAQALSPNQLVVIQPGNARELVWSLDQALRCRAVAAVWARLGPLPDRDLRRLQLSAEEGVALGSFVRLASARGQSSWFDLQIAVHAQATRAPQQHRPEFSRERVGWQLQLELLRGRGVSRPGSVEWELMAEV